jgi:hypothetical protein
MASLAFLLVLPAVAMLLLVSGERWKFLALFSGVIILQNIVTMLLLKSGVIGIQEGLLLLYIKEAILALALTYEFMRILVSGRVSVDRTDLLCFAYLVYCFVHFLLLSTDIPLGARLAGLRSLAILPSIYLLGRWILRSRRDGISIRFGRFYLAAAVAIAAVGVFEFVFLPDAFWVAVGQPEYYLMKMGYETQEGTLYGNMYASFGTFFLRRSASIIADPIMSTYFTVFGLLVVTFSIPPDRMKWLLLAAGSLMCMGRSAIMAFLLGIFEILLDRRKVIPFGWFSIWAFIALLGIPFLPFSTKTLATFFGSHYHGLVNAIEAVKSDPLGGGVGSASNLVASLLRAIGHEEELLIGDTFVGSLIAQIGIPGVLLFLAFNLSLSRKLFAMVAPSKAISPKAPAYFLGTAAFILGVTVLASINETGYGLTSAGLAFMFAGILTTEFYTRTGARGNPGEERLPDRMIGT